MLCFALLCFVSLMCVNQSSSFSFMVFMPLLISFLVVSKLNVEMTNFVAEKMQSVLLVVLFGLF